MVPNIIKGDNYTDFRGKLSFNNNFDASLIKRIYSITNSDVNVVRAWQGHKIEQRWFSPISGSFEIILIKMDNWDIPRKEIEKLYFQIDSKQLDTLHVPAGYLSSIRSLELASTLLVMSDFRFGEIDDDIKYDANYFEINKK